MLKTVLFAMYFLICSEMKNDAVYTTYNGPDITQMYHVYDICHYTCIVFATVCVYVCICVSTEMKFIALLNIQIKLLCLFTYCNTETYRNKDWGKGGGA